MGRDCDDQSRLRPGPGPEWEAIQSHTTNPGKLDLQKLFQDFFSEDFITTEEGVKALLRI